MVSKRETDCSKPIFWSFTRRSLLDQFTRVYASPYISNNCSKQAFFAAEVVVQRTTSNICCQCQFIHAGSTETITQKSLPRCVQNFSAGTM